MFPVAHDLILIRDASSPSTTKPSYVAFGAAAPVGFAPIANSLFVV